MLSSINFKFSINKELWYCLRFGGSFLHCTGGRTCFFTLMLNLYSAVALTFHMLYNVRFTICSTATLFAHTLNKVSFLFPVFHFRGRVFGRRLGRGPAALWETAFQLWGNWLWFGVCPLPHCGFLHRKRICKGMHISLWVTELSGRRDFLISICVRRLFYSLKPTHSMFWQHTTHCILLRPCQHQNLRSHKILLYPAVLLTSCFLCVRWYAQRWNNITEKNWDVD